VAVAFARLNTLSRALRFVEFCLERRAPARLKSSFPFKLAEAVLGAAFRKNGQCASRVIIA
jgi:hypothetical protein